MDLKASFIIGFCLISLNGCGGGGSSLTEDSGDQKANLDTRNKPGKDGENGLNGNNGFRGDPGLSGVNCFDAPGVIDQNNNGLDVMDCLGPIGTTGATGATGLTGASGANGATGARGLTGASGANGATGAAGMTGPIGPAGTGSQGIQGPTGSTGQNGFNGAQGAPGQPGNTGPQGPAGPTTLGNQDCYMVRGNRDWSSIANQGFYMKAIFKWTDNNWDGFHAMMCRADPSINNDLPTAAELLAACPWGWSRTTCGAGVNFTTYPAGIATNP